LHRHNIVGGIENAADEFRQLGEGIALLAQVTLLVIDILDGREGMPQAALGDIASDRGALHQRCAPCGAGRGAATA